MKSFVSAVLILFVFSSVLFAADLKTYKATYEKEMGNIAVEHGMNVSKLNESYSKSLNMLSDRATDAGDLDKSRAVMAEIERFATKKNVTPEDSTNSSPDLKKIQLYYLQNIQNFASANARRVLSLVSKFDSALGTLQTSLTRQKKLDDALAVQNERKAVIASEEVVEAKALLSGAAKIARQPVKAAATSKTSAKEEKVWLYEMEPLEAIIGWGKLGLGSDSGRGAKCIIKEKLYEKSVSAHAFSKLKYEIPKNAKKFCFGYGINYDATSGNCEFVVRVDERKKFSKKVKGNPDVKNREISIGLGAKELSLVVDSLGSQYNDHAVWVDPYFVVRQ